MQSNYYMAASVEYRMSLKLHRRCGRLRKSVVRRNQQIQVYDFLFGSSESIYWVSHGLIIIAGKQA